MVGQNSVFLSKSGRPEYMIGTYIYDDNLIIRVDHLFVNISLRDGCRLAVLTEHKRISLFHKRIRYSAQTLSSDRAFDEHVFLANSKNGSHSK